MPRNALKDTLVLHLAMLTRQCVVEEDASRMRKVHDALQERCTLLGASYEAVLQELALPRPSAARSSEGHPPAPSSSPTSPVYEVPTLGRTTEASRRHKMSTKLKDSNANLWSDPTSWQHRWQPKD